MIAIDYDDPETEGRRTLALVLGGSEFRRASVSWDEDNPLYEEGMCRMPHGVIAGYRRGIVDLGKGVREVDVQKWLLDFSVASNSASLWMDSAQGAFVVEVSDASSVAIIGNPESLVAITRSLSSAGVSFELVGR
ncbi:hypothetical protein [Cellulosimicrobium cellulans]|uniref:hypothetical protein n=1 Tax=Cellulosimicrobium cellulans TaxID=1710 RepID=UPI0024052896|nr:hypothetical protein [Cellulosimicrobium cellulans]MDF9878218.1 hypothetical protein [Cellulosimicrobium cellulans]